MEDDLLYLYNQNLANEATDLYDQRQRDLVNQAAMNVFQTGFNNQNQGIMSTEQAQPFEFLSSAYEDQDEDAEQVDYLPGQEPSGIEKLLSYLPFGENSILGRVIRSLPQESPEIRSMKNFYRNSYGLTDTGQVASGIMAGYNPVSGGFLNMITGGKFGKPTSYGLADAARKRIEKIANRKAAQTDASRARIKELQDFTERDTISRARQSNPNVYASADRQGFTNNRGGFSTSAADKAGTSVGSGQGFSNKSGRGRTGY